MSLGKVMLSCWVVRMTTSVGFNPTEGSRLIRPTLKNLDVDPQRLHALADHADDLDVTFALEVPQADGKASEPPAAQTIDAEDLAN